jgi:hypothetical protein
MAGVKAAENHPVVEYRICRRERIAASGSIVHLPPAEQDAAYALWRKLDQLLIRKADVHTAAKIANRKRAGFE